jgi:anionic cell wall polymer biosynthesis LytR-Cps2A-Psr (LCP) family protein
MNGYTALWYARSRHSTNDYDRMRRQHEVEDQVLKQMDPANVLSRVQQIMSAGKELVKTDIPSGMLFEYKNLAGKAKAYGIKSLNITPPNYDPVYPNFSKIHADIKAKFDAENKN